MVALAVSELLMQVRTLSYGAIDFDNSTFW